MLAVLLLTALTLVALDLRGGDGGVLAPLRSVGSTVFGPVERAAAAVVSPVRDFVTSVGSWGSQDERIAELERENARLRAQAAAEPAQSARAEQLARLLRVAGAGQYRTVPAQVAAVGPAQGFAWTVALDVGRRDGVKPGMTVINGDGLVGSVIQASATTSTVVLVVDVTTAVGVRVAGSQQIGVLSGLGRQDQLQMQLLDPLAPVRKGDRLVTGVAGTMYAAGLPVGEITEVRGTPGQLTRLAIVRPYVQVSSLDIVGVVIAPPRTDPRDSVLPPKPTPNASPSTSPSASPPAPSPAPGVSGGATTTPGTN